MSIINKLFLKHNYIQLLKIIKFSDNPIIKNSSSEDENESETELSLPEIRYVVSNEPTSPKEVFLKMCKDNDIKIEFLNEDNPIKDTKIQIPKKKTKKRSKQKNRRKDTRPRNDDGSLIKL